MSVFGCVTMGRHWDPDPKFLDWDRFFRILGFRLIFHNFGIGILLPTPGRHWDPSPNPRVLGLGLGSIFQNFGIGNGIGIDFSKVWDWAWDYKFRAKSQEIPKVVIEV